MTDRELARSDAPPPIPRRPFFSHLGDLSLGLGTFSLLVVLIPELWVFLIFAPMISTLGVIAGVISLCGGRTTRGVIGVVVCFVGLALWVMLISGLLFKWE
jgi:hypothetical protein